MIWLAVNTYGRITNGLNRLELGERLHIHDTSGQSNMGMEPTFGGRKISNAMALTHKYSQHSKD